MSAVVNGPLRLRPWQWDDTARLTEAFGAPDMSSQTSEPIANTHDALKWIGDREAEERRDQGYTRAVAHKDLGVVASIAVTAINRKHDTGWVSYWTVARFRDRKFATAGLDLLARWCFTDLGLFRLELGHRVNNPASCRVAWGAGFRAEGLERAKLRYDGVRFDVELHARLASDAANSP